MRPLAAQRQDLGDQRAVVVRAGGGAPRGPAGMGQCAEIASCGEGEERLDDGARQRDRVAVEAARGGRLAHAFPQEVRHAVEIRVAERQEPALLVGEHVLAERGVQHRQTFRDRGEACSRLRTECRTPPDEAEMHAVEKPALILREPEPVALRVQRVDAREQRLVEPDQHRVLRETRRHHAIDRLERLAAEADHEVLEHHRDAIEKMTGAFERRDRVREIGLVGDPLDRVDLVPMRARRDREGGLEMLRPDPVERRHAEIRGPGFEQRVRFDDLVHATIGSDRAAAVKRRPPGRRAPSGREGIRPSSTSRTPPGAACARTCRLPST